MVTENRKSVATKTKRPSDRLRSRAIRYSPKYRKTAGETRESFSIRLTPGLRADVEQRAAALGVTASLLMRHAILEALDMEPWPPFADPLSDEDADASGGAPLRIAASLRGEILRYQGAVGARDMSAAMRSLIAVGVRLPLGQRGVRRDA